MTNTKINATEASVKERHQCQCFTEFSHFLDDEDLGYDGTDPVYVACDGLTHKEFSQGHDARLKGLLLKLHRTGQEYTIDDGGSLTSVDPLIPLMERGWIASADEAASRKRNRSKASKSQPAQVKVGRWTYTVDSIDGDVVTYTTSKGETKTTTTDKLV